MIDRGYVFIRVYNAGVQVQRCAGPVNHPGVFDDAICLLNRNREKLHLGNAIQVIKEKHLSFKDAPSFIGFSSLVRKNQQSPTHTIWRS